MTEFVTDICHCECHDSAQQMHHATYCCTQCVWCRKLIKASQVTGHNTRCKAQLDKYLDELLRG